MPPTNFGEKKNDEIVLKSEMQSRRQLGSEKNQFTSLCFKRIISFKPNLLFVLTETEALFQWYKQQYITSSKHINIKMSNCKPLPVI